MKRGVAVVGLLVLCEAVPARAEITLDAPAGCPAVDVLRARVAARSPGEVDATVMITPGFAATITTADATRTLASGSCDELVDAIALVLARFARVPGAEPPVAPAVPAPSPRIVAAPRPAQVGSDASSQVALRIAGLAGAGAVSSTALGGELVAQLTRAGYQLELGAQQWQTGSHTVSAELAGSVDVRLTTAVLRAGLQQGVARIWITGELGRITGRGMDVGDARRAASVWSALGAGAGVALAVGSRVHVTASAEAVAPLVRPQYQLDSGRTIFQPDGVAAHASIGVEWRLR